MIEAVSDDNYGCEICRKPPAICVCDRLLRYDTKTRMLVLQHPQEQDLLLSSTPLVLASLTQAQLRVGLSWANLRHASGLDDVQPNQWAVLYPKALPRPLTVAEQHMPYVLMQPNKSVIDNVSSLTGLVVLDGTWSQVKTMWWRNPWLLKLPRLVLNPTQPSIYGKLRSEPHAGCIATLEAIADALQLMGEKEQISQAMRRVFRTMVQRLRDTPYIA